MKKISAVFLLASLLTIFHLTAIDGSDMICIKKLSLCKPCVVESCNSLCSGPHPGGWGECLKDKTHICQCNWACGRR